ncbi:MAG: hypothetical protein ACJ754_14780 [Pyrinomonadaceae bacterium]
MKLPKFTAERSVGASQVPAPGGVEPVRSYSVVPQGCSWTKKIACGTAFAACGASCALGPEICVPCLTAVGATDCLNCLLDW